MEIPLILKNGTNTKSEARLYDLCLKTFLRMWCYPSPYRHDAHDAKELCDVLVVIGNHVILFSDKNENNPADFFSKDKDEKILWKRWFKSRIYASAKQLWGGERYLRRNSTIYLDAKRSRLFPYKLPTQQEMIVHLVAVAGGASDECRKYFPDNIGSFRYFNKLKGQHKNEHVMDEFHDEISQFDPFHRDIKRSGMLYIGDVEKEKQTQQCEFIHVFTDESLELVLKELSTAKDFVEYLVARKRLFEECDVFATGEEHLLATYLTNINSDGVHDFLRVPKPCINVFRNMWNRYVQFRDSTSNTYVDKDSYMWDTIIDNIQHDYEMGRFIDSGIQSEEVEHVLRIMASENRLVRRTIVRNLNGLAVQLRTEQQCHGLIAKIICHKNTMYVLVVTHRPEHITDSQYAEQRLFWVDYHCRCAQYTLRAMQNMSIDHLLGFGIDSQTQPSTLSMLYVAATYLDEHDESQSKCIDIRHLFHIYETQIVEHDDFHTQ